MDTSSHLSQSGTEHYSSDFSTTAVTKFQGDPRSGDVKCTGFANIEIYLETVWDRPVTTEH